MAHPIRPSLDKDRLILMYDNSLSLYHSHLEASHISITVSTVCGESAVSSSIHCQLLWYRVQMGTNEESRRGDDLLKREEQARRLTHHSIFWGFVVNTFTSFVVFFTHLIAVR